MFVLEGKKILFPNYFLSLSSKFTHKFQLLNLTSLIIVSKIESVNRFSKIYFYF